MIAPTILIVEDNPQKQAEIENALEGFATLSTRSIAGAYRLISGNWEAVVLDMTFQVGQTRGHESTKEALAGIELLQFMASRSIPIPVIVATSHASFSSAEIPGIDSVQKLHALLKDAFPENYRETVEVKLSGEEWKSILKDAVVRAIRKDPQ